MIKRNPLVGIVTGIPNSFTTVVSQLLHCHPNVAAGVECGMLLSKIHDFNEIEPFWDWLVSGEKWGWCLNKVDRNKLLSAKNFEHAYEILNEIKGRENKDPYLKSIFEDSDLIFDKTPAYVFKLSEIMCKIEVPVVITLKTLNEGIHGLFKRDRKSVINIFKYFIIHNKALDQIIYVLKKYPERIFIADYKRFCSNSIETMRLISKHFDIEMNKEFSIENYNKRFGDKINIINTFQNDKIEYKLMPIKMTLIMKLLVYFLSLLSDIKMRKIKTMCIHHNF